MHQFLAIAAGCGFKIIAGAGVRTFCLEIFAADADVSRLVRVAAAVPVYNAANSGVGIAAEQ